MKRFDENGLRLNPVLGNLSLEVGERAGGALKFGSVSDGAVIGTTALTGAPSASAAASRDIVDLPLNVPISSISPVVVGEAAMSARNRISIGDRYPSTVSISLSRFVVNRSNPAGNPFGLLCIMKGGLSDYVNYRAG